MDLMLFRLIQLVGENNTEIDINYFRRLWSKNNILPDDQCTSHVTQLFNILVERHGTIDRITINPHLPHDCYCEVDDLKFFIEFRANNHIFRRFRLQDFVKKYNFFDGNAIAFYNYFSSNCLLSDESDIQLIGDALFDYIFPKMSGYYVTDKELLIFSTDKQFSEEGIVKSPSHANIVVKNQSKIITYDNNISIRLYLQTLGHSIYATVRYVGGLPSIKF